jgi:hypothetical protein
MECYMVARNPSGGDYLVMDYSSFVRQGGNDQSWGKCWVTIYARSASEARAKAYQYL